MSAVARALAVARSTLHRPLSPRQPRRPDAQADAEVLEELKAVVGQRATYGYRRACAVLNRQRRTEGKPGVNHKRAYRLMRQGLLLLQRHTGKPTRTHVLAQLPAWFDDYNRCHPHRGLKMKSPREFRTANSQP